MKRPTPVGGDPVFRSLRMWKLGAGSWQVFAGTLVD